MCQNSDKASRLLSIDYDIRYIMFPVLLFMNHFFNLIAYCDYCVYII